MLEREKFVHFDFHGIGITAVEHEGELWITGEDIGRALGYADPRDAIKKLYERNQEELDRYSVVLKVPVESGRDAGTAGTPAGDRKGRSGDKTGGLRGQVVPAGGGSGDRTEASGVIQMRSVRCFNEEGVMILTMLSSQPAAAEFREWGVKVLKAYRRGELALASAGQRDTVLALCIKEARFGNPVAMHTLIERFGYPESIRTEVKSELLRRAQRMPTGVPPVVDWFLDTFLPRLEAEISGGGGALLSFVRNRPPFKEWKERAVEEGIWCLQHRPSDLFAWVAGLAEKDGVEADMTSQRFGRWLAQSAGRMRERGWARKEIYGGRGNVLYQLILLKGKEGL